MSVYLEKAESAIANIQNKNSVPYHLSILRKMINAEFKCNCIELNLVENTAKGYFFGAHVFPTEKELYKITDNVIRIGENIKFEKCTEFVIELDSKLIYELDTTPREILAVVLHEVGHKAFSTKAQLRSKASFTFSVSKYIPTAALVLRTFSPIKFLVATIILTSFESTFSMYNGVKTEIEADKFVIVNGYAVDLNSVLVKLSNDSGKGILMGMGKVENSQEKAIMDWSITNAMSFSIRRAAIIADIERQLKGEPSPYLRKILQAQLKEIQKTKGSFSVKSIKNEEIEEIHNESMRSFFEIQNRGFSYLELDELDVEVERIESSEDKLYLINRIYKDIRQADEALESIASGEAKKKFRVGDVSAIKDYKKKLGEVLKKVKSVKITTPDYSKTYINITYPKGYEG